MGHIMPINLKYALPLFGTLAIVIFFGLWRLEAAETTRLEAEIDTLQDTVIDFEAALNECGDKIKKAEGIARDSQNRITDLTKRARADRMRADAARCIPIER
jgi:hypothetical protein